jgi:hypothetical protein
MKRLGVITIILAISASTTLGGPEKPWFPQAFQLSPGEATHYASRCDPGRPVQAVVTGRGASPLGVYVYNAVGQCVAHDDDLTGNLVDDRIVAWTPTNTGPYELEIRNLGGALNIVEAVFRGSGGGEK